MKRFLIGLTALAVLFGAMGMPDNSDAARWTKFTAYKNIVAATANDTVLVYPRWEIGIGGRIYGFTYGSGLTGAPSLVFRSVIDGRWFPIKVNALDSLLIVDGEKKFSLCTITSPGGVITSTYTWQIDYPVFGDSILCIYRKWNASAGTVSVYLFTKQDQ